MKADQNILPTVHHSANDLELLAPQSATDKLETEKDFLQVGRQNRPDFFLRSSEHYSLKFKQPDALKPHQIPFKFF